MPDLRVEISDAPTHVTVDRFRNSVRTSATSACFRFRLCRSVSVHVTVSELQNLSSCSNPSGQIRPHVVMMAVQ